MLLLISTTCCLPLTSNPPNINIPFIHLIYILIKEFVLKRCRCFCAESLQSNFGKDCKHTKYCDFGEWISTKISSYPKYAQAKHTPKDKKKSNRKRKRSQEPPVSQPSRKRVRIRVPLRASNASNPYLNVPQLE